MSSVAEQDGVGLRARTCSGGRRPVVLGTLSVRFDAEAERLALDSALHARAALIVANVVQFRPYVCTMALLGPSAATLSAAPACSSSDPIPAACAAASSAGRRPRFASTHGAWSGSCRRAT